MATYPVSRASVIFFPSAYLPTRAFLIGIPQLTNQAKTLPGSRKDIDMRFLMLGTGELGPNKILEESAFVVTSPVEGEELVPGAVHLITWTGAEDVKEVKYRDQTLKPKNEGEEVSQSIVSDSFETYGAGVFPRTGGWLTGMEKIAGLLSEISPRETPADALNVRPAGSLKDKVKRLGIAKTGAERESRGSEVLQSGEQGAQALNLSDGASENGAALIDDEDSVSGLRSFRLETVGIGSVSVVKRFSLPDRVPFGVSGGSFAIGVKPNDSQTRTGLREGSDRVSLLDRRSGKLGKENDPVTGPTSGVKNKRNLPAESRSADTALDQGSGDSRKTMTTLSASPVGNYYLYSFDGKLLQTYNVYGVLLKDYIYMGDRLIAEYDHVGARFLYYTPDQINSTRVVTDSAGTVVYSAVHDPYGGIQQTGTNNTYDPQLKFSGKERDAESELDYFGARYYDRSQYRFISVDPVFELEKARNSGWNMYSYCGDRPTSYIDPDGMSWIYYNNVWGQVYLVLNNSLGTVVGPFPAANNGFFEGHANPFPQGTWRLDYYNPNWIKGIDCQGAYIFSVTGHRGMGIHAHDEVFGYTYTDASAGCITIEGSTMATLRWWDRIDPIQGIQVDRADIELPALPVMTMDLLLASVQITRLLVTALPAGNDISWAISYAPK